MDLVTHLSNASESLLVNTCDSSPGGPGLNFALAIGLNSTPTMILFRSTGPNPYFILAWVLSLSSPASLPLSSSSSLRSKISALTPATMTVDPCRTIQLPCAVEIVERAKVLDRKVSKDRPSGRIEEERKREGMKQDVVLQI